MMKEDHKCYGSATVSERGQVVIPADARTAFDIKAGDKLIVFGFRKGGLTLMKASQVAEFVTETIGKLTDLKMMTDAETGGSE